MKISTFRAFLLAPSHPNRGRILEFGWILDTMNSIVGTLSLFRKTTGIRALAIEFSQCLKWMSKKRKFAYTIRSTALTGAWNSIHFHVSFNIFSLCSNNQWINKFASEKFSSASIEFYDTRNAVAAHFSSELGNRVNGTFKEFLSCAHTVCRGQ